MGTVYQAVDQRLGRRVAVKHLPAAALLAFNVGIEICQLAFIAVVLAAAHVLTVSHVLTRLPRRLTASLARSPAYVIGSLAAFWFFARLAT